MTDEALLDVGARVAWTSEATGADHEGTVLSIVPWRLADDRRVYLVRPDGEGPSGAGLAFSGGSPVNEASCSACGAVRPAGGLGLGPATADAEYEWFCKRAVACAERCASLVTETGESRERG